jgi:hypothetical protein
MLAGMLVLLAVLTVRGRFDDPDLWWHLKMGQIIWTTHSLPANDLFSYTTNHQALIPQEWLSQVVIYGAYLCGGYSGMMLWFCSMTALLLVAGYGLCWLYSGNAKVAFAGALIIWFFSTIGFSIRPQMMSYVLLVAELLLIHAGRTRNPRWFFWLPVVFIIWINCHASFILGIVVAGFYLFSSFFNFEIGSLVSPAHADLGGHCLGGWAVPESGRHQADPLPVRHIDEYAYPDGQCAGMGTASDD